MHLTYFLGEIISACNTPDGVITISTINIIMLEVASLNSYMSRLIIAWSMVILDSKIQAL